MIIVSHIPIIASFIHPSWTAMAFYDIRRTKGNLRRKKEKRRKKKNYKRSTTGRLSNTDMGRLRELTAEMNTLRQGEVRGDREIKIL